MRRKVIVAPLHTRQVDDYDSPHASHFSHFSFLLSWPGPAGRLFWAISTLPGRWVRTLPLPAANGAGPSLLLRPHPDLRLAQRGQVPGIAVAAVPGEKAG